MDNSMLRLATVADLPALLRLINDAYRGEKGWTTENRLVEGDRVTQDSLMTLIADPQSHLLIYMQDSIPLACFCVEAIKDAAYFGLFAVAPNAQGQGLGKQLLEYAEQYVKQTLQLERIVMSVVAQRTELVAYYLRRGFHQSGEEDAYPEELDVGTPRVAGLRVTTLEKSIV